MGFWQEFSATRRRPEEEKIKVGFISSGCDGQYIYMIGVEFDQDMK